MKEKFSKYSNWFAKITADVSDRINDCKRLTDLCFVFCEWEDYSPDQIKISLSAFFGSQIIQGQSNIKSFMRFLSLNIKVIYMQKNCYDIWISAIGIF